MSNIIKVAVYSIKGTKCRNFRKGNGRAFPFKEKINNNKKVKPNTSFKSN